MGGTFPAVFPFCFAEFSCDNLIPHESDNSLHPYAALVLTRAGEPTYSYYLTDRIKQFDIHIDPFKDTAKFILSNHDLVITALSLEGYKATIYIGLIINGIAYYQTLPPFWVMEQTYDSASGLLDCQLEMIGMVSSLQQDRASKEYKGSGSTKTLIDGVLSGSLSPYTHCTNWTVIWHGDTGVHGINLYAPSDAFKIDINMTRFSAVRQLLDFDVSLMRAESDEKFHLRRPVTTGTDYDWEFALSDHVFFTKRQNKKLVIPNYIQCTSKVVVDGVENTYQGNAQDADSITAYREIREYVNVSGLTSNAQATAIAQGVLNNVIQNQDTATMRIPPCYYIQLLDYIKVTDARENSTKTGNVGSIDWHFSPGKFYQDIGFGGWQNIRKVMADFWRDYQPDEAKTTFPYWFTASCPGTTLLPGQYINFHTIIVPRGRTLFIGARMVTAGKLRIVEWDADTGNWVDLLVSGSSVISGEATSYEAGSLVDTGKFTLDESNYVGLKVHNITDNTYAEVGSKIVNNRLGLTLNIMHAGDSYELFDPSYSNGQGVDVYDSYDVGGTPVAFVIENDGNDTIGETTAMVAYDCQYLPGGLP